MGESGDLEIDIADPLLPGEDPEIIDLVFLTTRPRCSAIFGLTSSPR